VNRVSPRAEVLELLGERFLDLADQVGALPHLGSVGDDLGSRRGIGLVGDGGPGPRPSLHQHRRPVPAQFAYPVGG
jgi:hypothetical protein